MANKDLQPISYNKYFQEITGGPKGYILVTGFCPNPVHQDGGWYGMEGPSVVDLSGIKKDDTRREIIQVAITDAIGNLRKTHDGLDGCLSPINVRALGKIGKDQTVLIQG